MSTAKKNSKQKINIEIDEKVSEGIYSNLAIINHSVSEFVIDFISIMPGTPKNKVKSRIIITPQHAKKLSKALNGNIKKFEELCNKEKRKKILNYLLELDGIGETQINSLETFFSNSNNLNTVSNLIKELSVIDFKTSKSGIFYGKTIMFTGGLSKMSRAEAKALVEKEGGKILGTTSKKLDY